MDDFAAERVLLAADLIPMGSVASYGDLGRLAGVGPRQVGAVMRERGGEVAWWRVVNASGRLPAHLATEAQAHWDAEGIGHTDGRVAMRCHRVDAALLTASYRMASMPGASPDRDPEPVSGPEFGGSGDTDGGAAI